MVKVDFPDGSVIKESSCLCKRRRRRVPSLGREGSPGVGNGNPFPIFLPGKFHGQRSLAGYSLWGSQSWMGLSTHAL